MRANKKEAPILLAQNGPLRGMNWVVNRHLTIGRDDDCDIVIPDRQVSRFHAEVTLNENGDFMLSDLKSKNGTTLNGELLLEKEKLKEGDEIKIALAQEFLFVSSDATLPLDRVLTPNTPNTKKLVIEKKARRIWVGDMEIIPALSVSQFDLLMLLYEKEGMVIKREEIVNGVWGEDESIGVTEQAIDALVRRLRARLNKIDPSHDYIKTVRGVGYIFENTNF